MRWSFVLSLAMTFLVVFDIECVESPSAEECMILGLLNDYRHDRRAFHAKVGQSLLLAGASDQAVVDFWIRNRLGMGGSVPPLVFNHVLNSAARESIRTFVDQQVDAVTVMQSAGYSPANKGFLYMVHGTGSLIESFAMACVGVAGERKGPGDIAVLLRTASEYLSTDWREVGIAVANKSGRYSMAILLGIGSAQRYLGGVVFADSDRNGVYEGAEGRSGVTVSADGKLFTTGPSGSWWIASTSDHMELTFSGDGFEQRHTIAKGTANQQLHWSMPLKGDVSTADRLIASANKEIRAASAVRVPVEQPKPAKGKEIRNNPEFESRERQRRALATLLFSSRRLVIDSSRQTTIDAMVAPIMNDYIDLVRRTIAAMDDSYGNFKIRLDRIRAPWGTSLEGLFKEAEGLYRLRSQVMNCQQLSRDLRIQLFRNIDNQIKASCEPLYIDLLRQWKTMIHLDEGIVQE